MLSPYRVCCLRNLILFNRSSATQLQSLVTHLPLTLQPLDAVASSSSTNISSKRYASGWSGSERKFDSHRRANRDTMFYVVSLGVIAIGLTFAAIPAYRIFCEATSFGGLTQALLLVKAKANALQVAKDFDKIEAMEAIKSRLIRVQFNADVPSSMRWNFKPLQNEIYVHPGETSLAFFSAKNPTDKPIVGISSYNLTPFQAAYYFNKIQCFCFEEQILNPGEEVELPVFFYIDPDYANDPQLENLDSVLLSYTFFEAKSGLQLPSPFDPQNRPNMQIPFSKIAADFKA